VKVKFGRICTILGVDVELEELVGLGESGLYRARVNCEESRRLLLNEATKLMYDEEFKSVHVQRDLTFLQHQELSARRATIRVSHCCGKTYLDYLI
jgi:hypothetical protein